MEGGVVLLWQLGSYPIAAVIFLASIVIPLAKIFALFWLYMNAQRVGGRWMNARLFSVCGYIE